MSISLRESGLADVSRERRVSGRGVGETVLLQGHRGSRRLQRPTSLLPTDRLHRHRAGGRLQKQTSTIISVFILCQWEDLAVFKCRCVSVEASRTVRAATAGQDLDASALDAQHQSRVQLQTHRDHHLWWENTPHSQAVLRHTTVFKATKCYLILCNSCRWLTWPSGGFAVGLLQSQ